MLSQSFARLATILLITVFWLSLSTLALGQTRETLVESPDGIELAVQESGNPDGIPIIFIHGLLGSRLNWEEQLQDAALQPYRLITYDLRGHGLSGKPTEAKAYTNGRRWADDLATVIDSLDAREPVLVGWSLGGAVITNYLAAYGDDDIAGAVYVNGVVELKPDQVQPHPAVYGDMISPDLKAHLDGERAFLGLCFHQQPDEATFERLLANAALASWDMQRAVQSMTIPVSRGLGEATVPLLFLFGARDALLKAEATINRARQLNPGIESILYPNSGHAPFLEEPERFNRDLQEFVERITQP